MKFQVDFWLNIDRDIRSKEEAFENYRFFLIPGIDFSLNKNKWGPNKDDPNGFKGSWFTICISWLIFGVTFDWRTGDNAKKERG